MLAWGLDSSCPVASRSACRNVCSGRQICSCLVKNKTLERQQYLIVWDQYLIVWDSPWLYISALYYPVVAPMFHCASYHHPGHPSPTKWHHVLYTEKNSWKNQDVYCSIVCAPTGGACCFGCRRNSRMVSENQPSASFGTYHEDRLLLRPTLLTGHPRFPVSPAGPCSPNFTSDVWH